MQYIGSTYDGEYVNGRMEGDCEYEFPPLLGSTYEGGIKDGIFHGEGNVYLDNSMFYKGTFENGVSKKGGYVFTDGLEYNVNEDWEYCDVNKNRLFAVEIKNGLNPAGRCLISNLIPPRVIPDGMYDSGDGFYDAHRRILFTYKMKFLRSTDDEEHDWIVGKCRKAEPNKPAEQENETN